MIELLHCSFRKLHKNKLSKSMPLPKTLTHKHTIQTTSIFTATNNLFVVLFLLRFLFRFSCCCCFCLLLLLPLQRRRRTGKKTPTESDLLHSRIAHFNILKHKLQLMFKFYYFFFGVRCMSFAFFFILSSTAKEKKRRVHNFWLDVSYFLMVRQIHFQIDFLFMTWRERNKTTSSK